MYCQVAVGQGKKKSSGDSPHFLGIIAPHVGAVELLGGWNVRKWRKEKNRFLFLKTETVFPLLQPKINGFSWSSLVLLLGFVLTLVKLCARMVDLKFGSFFLVHLLPFTFQSPQITASCILFMFYGCIQWERPNLL